MEIMREAADKLGINLSKTNKTSIVFEKNISPENLKNKLKILLTGNLPEIKVSEDESYENEDKTSSFPLTDIQYAYLIGQNAAISLGGTTAAHYIEIETCVTDFKCLNNALNHTIERHPVMRAELTDSGRQRFSSVKNQYVIAIQDYSSYNPHSMKEKIEKTRTEMMANINAVEKNQSFDIRATIIKKNTFRLHLCFDLMFFDLHSIKIIIHDWWQFYHNPLFNAGKGALKFSEYIAYENKIKKSTQGELDKKYWLSKISNILAAPELPISQSPELIKQPVISTLTEKIPPKMLNKLHAEAIRNGITLEVLFLGAYTEVLSKWSRRQQFTLTVTQNGRRTQVGEINRTTGNCLQSSLLCVKNHISESFIERLINLQTELLLNRWHSTFNGVQVLREITRINNDGRAFSLPIVFSNTLNSELKDIVFEQSSNEDYHIIHSSTRTPGVWLENQLIRQNGELIMRWNYVESLFPEGMPEAMFDATLKLLSACVEECTIWSQYLNVVSLPIFDIQERKAANATQRQLPPKLLHDDIFDAAHRYPKKTAVIQGKREVSYQELIVTANHIAGQISSQVKIIPGDIIAVSLPQGPEMLAAILGVLTAGAAYVSIDPHLPEQRKNWLIERCTAKAVITSSNSLFMHKVIITETTIINNPTLPVPNILRKQLPDDLAYVIFTSGSTGEPKGVMITHRNATNTITDINHRFNINSEDRVYSIAPAGFDLSVYDYFGVLGAGGSILFAEENEPADPKIWAQKIVEHQVTLWNTVPAPVKALFERAGSKLTHSTLRLVLMSGDWIPIDLPGQIHDTSSRIEVISLGGATEGSIWSIVYPVTHVNKDWKSIPYGTPLANQRFHVLNEWLEPCPKWVTGELFIAGDGVARGYLGDEEKTKLRFFTHPHTGERLYRTGDLGRYINHGLLEILGREDNQVKINGYRIELGEIEAALLGHSMISHVVINAIAHPKTGQKQLAAYLVAANPTIQNKQTLENELRELAAATLPSYMIPTWFVLLNEMPLTANGKIDRKALPNVWADNATNVSKSEPVDEIESHLYSIWIEQLKHSDFGVTDGFFDIGGDSLHAVSLLSLVRQAFNVSPSSEQDMIESLFMNASVRDFSKILTAVNHAPEEAVQ